MIAKNNDFYKKIKRYNKEQRDLAYVAGISTIGIAYKLSIAPIDIADALIVEKEAINLTESFRGCFEKFTPKMLMHISASAMKMSKNLDKYKNEIQRFSL